MLVQAIAHQTMPWDVYAISRKKLVCRIRVARQDMKECKLIYWLRTEPDALKEAVMTIIRRDNLFDYYMVSFSMEPAVRYIKYYFELVDNHGRKGYFSSWGWADRRPGDGFFEYLYTNEHEIINPPAWASGQVYYQIFPERFSNGGRINERSDVQSWGTPPTRENFMGGDLAGILQKIDYLSELSVDCLYLTPVFQADFNHKYATTDYYAIDPDFGDKQSLRELVAACHKKGMRILLDGVFNHCGVDFPPFSDVLANQENSKYRDWFYIKQYPVSISKDCYECVGDYQWMPKLRTANPEVREFVLDVMKYWIREADIDGWRLDVADEVDYAVWQQARTELKELNPAILLLGETWGDAAPMLLGNQMDSAMNYLFREIVLAFFAHGTMDAATFNARIENLLAKYNWETVQMLYNPLDSHDTSRFFHECGGDASKFKLAVAFQMLFCGCPAIFYGDEIGLSGENDPDCRRCMIWDPEKQNQEILSWYKQLIHIRKTNAAISRGSYLSNVCDPDGQIYGFVRRTEAETIYTVFNNSRIHQGVTIPVLEEDGDYEDLLSGERYSREILCSAGPLYNQDILEYKGQVSATLPAYSVKVLQLIR